MQTIKGKHIHHLDAADIAAWTASFNHTVVDLGTGDGRFVRHLARQQPDRGVIGVDLAAANLRAASRTATGNALFVVADALALPEELHQVARCITITMPWGSLLRGLLTGHPGLLAGLSAIGANAASLAITLNAAALAEAGSTLAAGSERVAAALREVGITAEPPRQLDASDIRRLPTTWAKRLAFGRDPRAVRIEAVLA